MISTLKHTFIITTVFFLNIEMYICTCARAEYEINGECCPMCPPGSCVFRHCTEFTSTTCKHCVGLTYTDEPNGLASCISCTVCDAGQGLRVKAACTQTSDTVCEPLEGFYCTDKYRGSCIYSVEHTKCSPGQYIKQKGTALKDAECAECSDGTYSNGSLLVCKPHSTCEDFALTKIKPGTKSLDTECGKTPPVALITGALLGLTAVVAVAGALFFIKRCHTCPPRADSADSAEFHRNMHEKDYMKTTKKSPPTLIIEDRVVLCAFNHTGHVASPDKNDCEKQPCDPQENEFTHWT
ncbi:tumor necrosis factor receptor superfamily member 14-like [Tachysurus fulvidraco]|uniref:tumor necrosis factor receptor superfamily member 14-like n=1 Tax=Tachysurus fulvidraco TaxID=1234273 RepID=UPI000F4DFF8F|nr:tumor necrosis factor receptor superfamily member 14-like [Tachysurus fulvidraco]